jgi:hypothetical protein
MLATFFGSHRNVQKEFVLPDHAVNKKYREEVVFFLTNFLG